MKRLLPLILAVCLVMSACGTPSENGGTSTSGSTAGSTEPTTEPTTVPTEEPTTQPTTAPATQPTEPPVLYTNPLTGEPMDAPSENRPFAVMFNNIKAAMPQHGISQADILYEVLAEGGITRCMGVFYDIGDVEALGSVRSARRYYVDIARSYDAIYVHAGWSYGYSYDPSVYAKDYLNQLDWDHINGVEGSGAGNYFYRDQNRLNAGYSKEHTLFITGEDVIAYAEKMKCTMTREGGVSYGLQFDDDSLILGENATEVVVNFNTGSKPNKYTKSTTFTYDESTGTYFAAQYGGDYIDGNTDETVAFRNVLVLKAPTSTHTDGKLMIIDLVGSGEGYFACNGQIVPIKWSRAGGDEPFVYTLEDGSPLTLGVGTSYIGIVPTKGVVEYT